MLRVKSLSRYEVRLRTNARTGDREPDALDPKRQNYREHLAIPHSGFILKPNEVYIVEVDNPGSEAYVEENFTADLSSLGVSCRILDDECYLTVQRPVRIYPDTGLFYEDKT